MANEVSSINRIMVTHCIINFVHETDQLKDVTLELNEALGEDSNLYSSLMSASSEQKVTGYRFQQLVKFLRKKEPEV